MVVIEICLICGAEVENDNEGEARICDKCWCCPKCGAGKTGTNSEGDFVLEDDDLVVCSNCRTQYSNRSVEKALMKKLNRVKCPTCKGCGTVPKK
jgi:DNA-directed RNA polymerase subunit RPC12/RpoP